MQTQIYHPKANHPWRRYKDRKEIVIESDRSKKVKEFIFTLVESWDTYTIDFLDKDSYDKRRIKYMSDEQLARWIVDFLRRNFISNSSYYQDDEEVDSL